MLGLAARAKKTSLLNNFSEDSKGEHDWGGARQPDSTVNSSHGSRPSHVKGTRGQSGGRTHSAHQDRFLGAPVRSALCHGATTSWPGSGAARSFPIRSETLEIFFLLLFQFPTFFTFDYLGSWSWCFLFLFFFRSDFCYSSKRNCEPRTARILP